MFCKRCGKVIDEGSVFCNSCGMNQNPEVKMGIEQEKEKREKRPDLLNNTNNKKKSLLKSKKLWVLFGSLIILVVLSCIVYFNVIYKETVVCNTSTYPGGQLELFTDGGIHYEVNKWDVQDGKLSITLTVTNLNKINVIVPPNFHNYLKLIDSKTNKYLEYDETLTNDWKKKSGNTIVHVISPDTTVSSFIIFDVPQDSMSFRLFVPDFGIGQSTDNPKKLYAFDLSLVF